MGLSIGIVGLPNVGKSTFFQILTKNTSALIANYPFATIEPNIGVVHLDDIRAQNLQKIYNSKKIVPNFIKFIDIAGLVKGASEGKGLGNKFLSHIKEVDVICNIVRCFENKDITHVENRIDPISDIEIINLELIIDDLKNVKNALNQASLKKLKVIDSETYEFNQATLLKSISILEQEKMLDSNNFTNDEWKYLKQLNLLTTKKRFYVINVSENDWASLDKIQTFHDLTTYLQKNNYKYVVMPLKFEHDLSAIESESDKLFYQEMYNIKNSNIDKIIKIGFNLLGLKTFFTCGPQEIHAWTFKAGSSAKTCAGIIHSDIHDGFIKAEIINYDQLKLHNDVKKTKELGLYRIEGKEYQLNDGDICYFHFNKK